MTYRRVCSLLASRHPGASALIINRLVPTQALTVAMVALALLGSACRTTGGLSPATLSRLKETPQGFLSGEVQDLREHTLMNNTDFVYSAVLSPDGARAAYSHLGPKEFQVGLWALGATPRQLADPGINHYQYDVESLDFSPDGQVVVTASRDGALRFFSADDGALVGAYATEEPLVSVAFDPRGEYVVAGSARGLLTVVSFPGLAFSFEQRAHQGEVRNLSFSRDRVLFSGGWDKSIVSFHAAVEQVATDSARVRFERRGSYSVIRGMVEKVPTAFVFDTRVPFVVVSTEVAKAAGIDVAFLKDTTTLPTPLGNALVRIAKNRTLTFKALRVTGVDLAVCDACLPQDAQAVLGQAFAERYAVAFDEISGEAVIAAKVQAENPEQRAVMVLNPRKRLSFPWYVNDFSLDRSGRFLGVAFSEVKAERTREVYEREKRGEKEPLREGNAGAIVDADTGLVVRKWNQHLGVVSTAAISPDGKTLATGGWDKYLYLYGAGPKPLRREFGWSVRRVRFSEDGRYLVVAAWTPQNPIGDQQSDPSALIYEVEYQMPTVEGGSTAAR